MVEDICTYYIQLRGRVEEDEVNRSSPLALVRQPVEGDHTHFCVLTDQSGMVGLIRHLHGLGFVLLSLTRAGEEA